MKGDEAAHLARLCFPNLPTNVVKLDIQPLCRLWSGMGHIYKVSVVFPSSSNSNVEDVHTSRSFVIKRVDPPPSGRKMSMGDRRKAASYIVEANFYQHCANQLIQYGGISLPEPLFVDRKEDGQITICMSHLLNDDTNYNGEFEESAIRWLAKLHATTWGPTMPCHNQSTSALLDALQPVGSYWHLDTRPDEHESMPRSGWQGRLKRAARALDARLKRDSMQCIIHGDPKDANILWADNNRKEVVFCDFQYCGKGCPTQDLAYFLCSSTDPDDETKLLDAYYKELVSKLPADAKVPSMSELKDSLEIAYCDFARFMSGWGFWGFDVKGRVIAVLDRLDGGRDLGSEELYNAAVRREYG